MGPAKASVIHQSTIVSLYFFPYLSYCFVRLREVLQISVKQVSLYYILLCKCRQINTEVIKMI